MSRFKTFIVAVLALLAVPPLAAQTRSADSHASVAVLAFGQGTGTSGSALAAFEASGAVPPADLNQRDQYVGIEQAGPTFGRSHVGRRPTCALGCDPAEVPQRCAAGGGREVGPGRRPAACGSRAPSAAG